jgi:hypothetical protein
MLLPYTLSCVLWLAWFWWLWGSPSPSVPYGTAHQMSLGNLRAGFPGVFADQEYGIFACAPAFAMTMVAWRRLWRGSTDDRWLAAVTEIPSVILAGTVGAFQLWWGGSAPPGRELVAILPLMGVPLAWLWRERAGHPVQRASLEWLVLVGAALTATLVLVHGGLLIANGRDGSSELLDYLEPTRQLVRVAPSFIAFRDEVAVPLVVSAVWVAVAAAAWIVGGRLRASTRGVAALVASWIGLAALAVVAIVVPLVIGGRLPKPLLVESRGETPALTRFGAISRPLAIEFTPWRLTTPADAIHMVRFVATPGLRQSPQPVRVLLNMRLSLPAGTYRVQIDPVAGQTLSGDLGLQVGRIGPPAQTWSMAAEPERPWSVTFTLDVDANFVAFRATPAVESRVARVQIAPERVSDAGDRVPRPPVFAAARYGPTPVYFHDDRVYPEADGFWVRGRATTEMTVGLPGGDGSGIRLQLHGGRGQTPVDISTPAWSTHVTLTGGATTDVVVPVREGQTLLALSVTPRDGFVPAQQGGAPSDRRLLGCWVAIVH